MLSPAIPTIEDPQGPSRRTHKSLSCRSAPEIHAAKRVFPTVESKHSFFKEGSSEKWFPGLRSRNLERMKRGQTIELRLRTRRVDRGIEAEVAESAEGIVESQAE